MSLTAKQYLENIHLYSNLYTEMNSFTHKLDTVDIHIYTFTYTNGTDVIKTNYKCTVLLFDNDSFNPSDVLKSLKLQPLNIQFEQKNLITLPKVTAYQLLKPLLTSFTDLSYDVMNEYFANILFNTVSTEIESHCYYAPFGSLLKTNSCEPKNILQYLHNASFSSTVCKYIMCAHQVIQDSESEYIPDVEKRLQDTIKLMCELSIMLRQK